MIDLDIKNNSYNVAIMADIVGSRDYKDVLDLHKKFNKVVDSSNNKYKKFIISPLTITLGDEFQGIVDTIYNAFIVANSIRVCLLSEGISCRFSIGYVFIESNINSQSSWNMMGHGLAEVRSKLNEKNDIMCYNYILNSSPNYVDQMFVDVSSMFMTKIENSWTLRQALVVKMILVDGLDVSEIANKLNVSSSSIYSIIKSSEYKNYAKVITMIGAYFHGFK